MQSIVYLERRLKEVIYSLTNKVKEGRRVFDRMNVRTLGRRVRGTSRRDHKLGVKLLVFVCWRLYCKSRTARRFVLLRREV